MNGVDDSMEKKVHHLEHSGYDLSFLCNEETLIDYFLKNEETYKDLFQNEKAVVLLIDQNNCKILDANKAASEFYGCSQEELKAMGIQDIDVHIMELSKIAGNDLPIECKIAEDKNYFFSKHMLANGDIRDVKIYRSAPLVDKNDIHYVVVRDVTEQKKAEEKIILSSFSLENNADVVLWVNEFGDLLYANKAASELLEYSEEELLNMNIRDFDVNYSEDLWNEHWKYLKENIHITFESAHRCCSGKIYPVEITANYLVYYGNEYNCAVIRNISKRKKAQRALADEVNWRRSLMEESRDGIVILDLEGKVFKANPAFAKMLGYTLEEMKTLHIWDWAEGYSKEELVTLLITDDFKGGPFETRQYRKDGTHIDVEIASDFIYFSEKKLVLCICRDITERKKDEEELKLASFSLENSSDAVFRMEKTGRIFYVNKASCELLGYSEEELLSKSVCDINPFFKQYTWSKHWKKIKNKKTFHIETSLKTKSGKMCPVDITSAYMDYKGKEYDCAFVRDLTENKKREKDLLESRGQLRTLLDTIPDLVWLKDVNSKYLACNAEFEHLYGAEEEEIIGKADYDFVDKKVADFFVEMDRKAINAGNPIVFEEEVVYADDGHRVWLETIKSPVHDENGQLIGVLGVGRNITQRKNAEDELKKASHSLENSSDAVAWLEKNGNVFFINKGVSNLVGYPREELLSMSIFDFDKSITQEMWDEHWEKLCNEKTLLIETTIPTKSGKICPVEVISNYMNYEGKEYDCTFVRDLTERKKAEKGLKLACFSLENFSDAVFWTRSNGEFFFVNKSACSLLGYSKEELLNMSVTDISPELTLEKWNESWNQLKEKKSFTFQSMHLTKEKRLLPVEITINYMVYNGKEYNYAIVKDISERLKSENALSEEIHWRRLLMEESRDGMVILEGDGSVFETNRAFAEMLGYTVEEIQKMYVWDWDANFNRQQLLEMIQCSDFRGVLFETKQKCKDGTILNIEINSNLMAYSGKKLVFCVCRDITEKKRYADELLKAKITAEEASLTKNEFLATMSHELRTPLNSIIGFSEILKGEDFGKINEAQAEYIDYISKSGKHLLNVINDILDLSKIEAGRMELNYEQFYLLDSINEVKMSLTPLAIKKRVDLDLELTSLPETIIADRTKLQEIIYNLASNAIKFTPEKGKVTIKASTDDRLISISIQDTGIGISTADMDKLFQPFKQIKPYMNHELEGTGLGLAITKKFIEMHGGRISVQSKPGDGSSFTFTIPKEPEYENINVDA